jgi:hypothetical protein
MKGQAVYLCMNVTLKHVRIAIFAMEKQYCLFWLCVCSFSCTAYKAPAPFHIAICCFSCCTIFFSRYFMNGTIFGRGGGRVIGHKMCVLIFSTTSVWKTSHLKKKWARCYHKCTEVFMSSTLHSCHILMTIELSS